MDIVIQNDQDKKTVLDILRGELRLSGAMVTFLKKKETGILLNGERVTVRRKVQSGDVLSLDYADDEDTELSDILPVCLPLDILYEDEDIMVVNKPPHMPTHPSHTHQTDTLANAIAHLCRSRGVSFVFRAVNRLDRDTGGTVLLAKNKLSAARLSEQMAKQQIEKSYLAILHGTLTPPRGKIEAYMHLGEGEKMKRTLCQPTDTGAMYSLTSYQTIAENDRVSCVLASPVTGRTHQLRVHFSAHGCPIVGDTLYGQADAAIGRQALHAYRLSFTHPTSGAPMTVIAPPMEDLADLFEQNFGKKFCFFKEEIPHG